LGGRGRRYFCRGAGCRGWTRQGCMWPSPVGYHTPEDPTTYVNGARRSCMQRMEPWRLNWSLNTTESMGSQTTRTQIAPGTTRRQRVLHRYAGQRQRTWAELWRAFSPPGTNQATTSPSRQFTLPAPPIANPQPSPTSQERYLRSDRLESDVERRSCDVGEGLGIAIGGAGPRELSGGRAWWPDWLPGGENARQAPPRSLPLASVSM